MLPGERVRRRRASPASVRRPCRPEAARARGPGGPDGAARWWPVAGGGVVVWIILGLAAVLVAAQLLVARYEYRQVQLRTRRHLEAGGRIREAPDMTPGHGGGAAGG